MIVSRGHGRIFVEDVTVPRPRRVRVVLQPNARAAEKTAPISSRRIRRLTKRSGTRRLAPSRELNAKANLGARRCAKVGEMEVGSRAPVSAKWTLNCGESPAGTTAAGPAKVGCIRKGPLVNTRPAETLPQRER